MYPRRCSGQAANESLIIESAAVSRPAAQVRTGRLSTVDPISATTSGNTTRRNAPQDATGLWPGSVALSEIVAGVRGLAEGADRRRVAR
jgi:hypothetical protein